MRINDGEETVIEKTLVPHTAFEEAMKRIKQCVKYSSRSSEPICLAVVGESRCGKSRALEETEALHPPVRTKDGLIVKILRVKVPSNPTSKNLAETLLKALGDLAWSKGTESEQTARLYDLLHDCQVTVILLDEFQHFFDKGRQKVFTQASEWLKVLVDETKICLIVTGLESSLPILEQNEQLSGRFLAPVRLRRFDWTQEKSREEFIGILDSFADALRTQFAIPDIADEDMAFRFWCATGGLIGYLAKLLRQAVWNAEDAESKNITLGDFKLAYEQSIWADKEGRLEGFHPFEFPGGVSHKELLTQVLCAAVARVGVKKEIEPLPRLRSVKASTKGSVNQVLTMSGGA